MSHSLHPALTAFKHLSPPLPRHAAAANSQRSQGFKGRSLFSNEYEEIQSYRLVSIFESRIVADSLLGSRGGCGAVVAVSLGRTHTFSYTHSPAPRVDLFTSHRRTGSLSSGDRSVHSNYCGCNKGVWRCNFKDTPAHLFYAFLKTFHHKV